MAKPKPRDYTIDGRPYAVAISGGDADDVLDVELHVTFRALYGKRSCCLVRGLTNRSYWHDYPNVETMRAGSISLTPRIVCQLVRMARQSGWNAEATAENFELQLDRNNIRAISEFNEAWPYEWSPAISEEQRRRLETELQRELREGHVLCGLEVVAVAVRQDLDDVVFELADGRLAMVHLAWSVGSLEGPFTVIFSDLRALSEASD